MEQELLAIESSAESGQLSVRADYPVARHDDRDRIRTAGCSDCSRKRFVAERFGKSTVTPRLTVRNLFEEFPDRTLELVARRSKFDFEVLPFAREVLVELGDDRFESLPVVIGTAFSGMLVPPRHRQSGQSSRFIRGQGERANWRVDDGASLHMANLTLLPESVHVHDYRTPGHAGCCMALFDCVADF